MLSTLIALTDPLIRTLAQYPAPAIAVAAAWVGAVVGTLPHELAHAAAARAFGATHVRVVLGLGPGIRIRPPNWRLHWLALHLRVCPIAGHARAHGPGLDGSAVAQAAIALAGPLASVAFAILLAVALMTLQPAGPFRASGFVQSILMDAVVFSVCGALQLVPGLGTDGSHAMRSLGACRRDTRRPIHVPHRIR